MRETNPAPVQFLDLKRLEGLLLVNARTIRRWIAAGDFPPGRILEGRKQRIWTAEEVGTWQREALANATS